MSVFESIPSTPPVLRAELAAVGRGAARCGGVPCPLQRSHARVVPPRPAPVLPVGRRLRSCTARRDPCAHRAVPRLDGAARARRGDDRSAAVHRVRLLPLRPHRRPHHGQPGPVRTTTTSPSDQPSAAWTVASWPRSSTPPSATSPMHAALAVLLGLNGLRVSEACGANIEDLGFERGHRTCRSSARATSPPRSRSCREPLAPSTSPSANATTGRSCSATTVNGSIRAPPTGGCDRSATGPASTTFTRTCCGPRSSWPPSTPASRCATSRSPPATPIRAPPPCTTGDARTSTDTPPTSSSPSSPAADCTDTPPTSPGTSVR